MKPPLRNLGVTITVSLFPALLSADAPPQPQVSLVQDPSGSWDAGWAGVPYRIYTIQVSPDLVNWMYAPVLEFGPGAHEWTFSSTSDKAFLRLKYEDHPEVETLAEAKLLSLDGSGLPGDWKVRNGLDPFAGTGVDGPDGDKDGDGVPNKADARPDDASIGEAVISITSPANGATIN